MPYEIIRFPYDGTIDADGHVLEPAGLWEEDLEAAHRPHALRIRVDAAGLEYLELAGRPAWARALERFVVQLAPAARAKLLGENVWRLYRFQA